MDVIMNFLNNNWVTSIITGLLVFFVTELIKRLKEKKSYFLKVAHANKEVFNTLKYSIPEENLPTIQVLRSIHKATAKRYNVKIEDVDSLQEILDDLIKEIMDSNFLSHDNKLRYCQRLLGLQNDFATINEEESSVVKYYQMKSAEQKRALSFAMSFAFGLVTTLMTFILTLIKEDGIIRAFSQINTQEVLIVLATLMGGSVGLIIILLKIRIDKIKRKKGEFLNDQDKNKDNVA